MKRQLGGFLVLDKEPLDIVAYYHGILSKQLSLHQSTLLKMPTPTITQSHEHKRLFKRMKKNRNSPQLH